MSTVRKYVPADGNTVRPAAASPADSRSRFSSRSAATRRNTDPGSRSPVAIAYWNGPPFTYVRNCLTVRTAAVSSGDAHTQPIFQPVQENVLPPDEIVTVRSRIPGNV